MKTSSWSPMPSTNPALDLSGIYLVESAEETSASSSNVSPSALPLGQLNLTSGNFSFSDFYSLFLTYFIFQTRMTVQLRTLYPGPSSWIPLSRPSTPLTTPTPQLCWTTQGCLNSSMRWKLSLMCLRLTPTTTRTLRSSMSSENKKSESFFLWTFLVLLNIYSADGWLSGLFSENFISCF